MGKTIDLYMISGFLGSGKTSFLKKFINQYKEKKIGVLVNEAGDISIDTKRLHENGIAAVELTNGSVYCACLKGKFIDMLIELSKRDLDALIIENSGMADPSNIHRILKELDQYTDRNYNYCGNICIVNANQFLGHVEILISVQRQVCTSNIVLVNKCDLVSKEKILKVRNKVRELNPSAFIFETTYGQVPKEFSIDLIKDNGFDDNTTNKCNEKLATCSLVWEGKVNIEDLRSYFDMISDDFFRIKGRALTDKGWYQIDIQDQECNFVKAEESEVNISEVVLISKDKYLKLQWIKEIWSKVVKVELI